ncbi:MAG: Rne/Rng family ribonuclease [Acidobacteria bacterium]|nr:Rne/Rng family ribonuclease [Acidobacteriota bacterium]
MSKEMIVSVNGREKKIAILDNGKVTEFYIERGEENSGVVGNVYKGKVMRVLPGMQSAFVDIGLERDAFLYVSDFFDEEEEIERIVMEKGKKGSPEDAKREANEQIERQRIEREKQMEAVQEVAEPLIASPVTEEGTAEESAEEKPKRGRGSRGRKGKEDKAEEQRFEPSYEPAPVFEIEFDNSGFERISDDGEADDTGEMFKDAYVQEAIVDRVRAAEFQDDPIAEAEVGSLLAEVGGEASGFERIADEEEEAPAPAKKGRAKKEPAAKKPQKAKVEKKPAAKKEAKPKAPRKSKKAAAEEEPLGDAEASVSAPDEVSEMAVRRGGRGRRRGGAKPKGKGHGDDNGSEIHADLDPAGIAAAEAAIREANGPDEMEGDNGSGDNVERPGEQSREEKAPEAKEEKAERNERSENRGRERGGRGGRGRGGRDGANRTGGEGQDNNRENNRDRNARGGGGRNDRRDRGPQPAISDLLKEGQEILVQIAKEPIAKKGARITSHIALPGRYLVYMPTIEHLGVSRKIESSNERGRLRTMLQKIRQDPEIPSGGFIVRTAGIGISEEDLRNDAKFLARSWQDAKKGSEKKKSPALVHQDLDLVQRLLRDQLSDDFTAIRVDSEEEYLRTVEFMQRMAPKMVNRVKLYTRDEPILDAYNVQEEIDKALKPRVWLKSGGYLVINQTEALVSIDVNTGKFVGKGNQRLEDTITRTNMEAVDEIARQIRLRDLGGIIVLDLIDMEDRRNRHKVSQALQEALQHDKSPTKVLSFNDFGLIIMTRKRVKQSLERTMCAPCDNCEGAGWVKSPTTVCYEILAEARRLSKQLDDVRQTTLRVHPEVSNALRNSERDVMEEIEHYLGAVDIDADKSTHQGQFDFAFI